MTSFIWILYLDTILLPRGEVAYFFDEFWSSWTAWLGLVLLCCSVFIEKSVSDAIQILKGKGLPCERRCREFNQVKDGPSPDEPIVEKIEMAEITPIHQPPLLSGHIPIMNQEIDEKAIFTEEEMQIETKAPG